jgi:hypothetical protein
MTASRTSLAAAGRTACLGCPFRYRDGTLYIFSNVNGQTTQLFRATNPGGPWNRTPMERSLHDLPVLFDG